MIEIRTIGPDDAALFRARQARGFGRDPDTSDEAAERFEAIFEYDRTFAAFDGDDIVGTCAAFSLGVTVPGGIEVPMGGTTVISVQPTHRRRGILRALMERHLEEIADRGEPLAGLWASEGSIYERFGYGPATHRYRVEARGDSLTLAMTEPTEVTLTLGGTDSAGQTARSLYESSRLERVGSLTRNDAWWRYRILADPVAWRGGSTALRYVIAEENGKPTGYAAFRQKDDWQDFRPNGKVEIVEIVTRSDESRMAIWRFLLNIDLYPNVDWWNMPLDDPLPDLVTDHRRIERTYADSLWVRLMDVPGALEARRYEADGSLRIEVVDGMEPGSNGIYELLVENGAATCSLAHGGEFDVSLGAAELGRLYLGGGNALALAAAGRIAGDVEEVKKLQQIFVTLTPPWCPEVF